MSNLPSQKSADNTKFDSPVGNVPAYQPTGDKIKDSGIGPGASTVSATHVNALSDDAKKELLSNIHMEVSAVNQKQGFTRPYRMDNNGLLEVVDGFTAQFGSYDLPPPRGGNRRDFAITSYTEVESQLWMQSAHSSTQDVGIPFIFNIKVAHKHVRSTFTYQRGVKLHCVYNQLLPKADITLHDCRMSEAYVKGIRNLVEVEYPSDATAKKAMQIERAKKLLEFLDQQGHFVATSFLCGGRYSLQTTKTLTEESTQEKEKTELSSTMEARFEAMDVPVTADGGWGGSSQKEVKEKRIGQYSQVTTNISGGDPSLGSSKTDILGKEWMQSLGPANTWAVCAFNNRGLTLTLDLLGDWELSQKCKDILRVYFKSQLRVKRTPFVGHDEEKWNDIVQVDTKIVANRLRKVELKIYNKLDGLRSLLQWESGNQEMQPWRGATKGYDYMLQSFELDPDDEIIAIRVGWDKSIDALIFYTANGREFPRDASYRGVYYEGIGEAYGGNGAVKWATVAARNVKGLHGTSKAALDGIGLQYLELDDYTPSKSFLLAIEPYVMND